MSLMYSQPEYELIPAGAHERIVNQQCGSSVLGY